MNPGHVVTAIFAMAVTVGVIAMVLRDSPGTNSVLAAGTTGITGLIKANESA